MTNLIIFLIGLAIMLVLMMKTPELICVGKPPDLPMVPEAKENHRNPRIPVIFVRSWDDIKGGCAHIRGEAGP